MKESDVQQPPEDDDIDLLWGAEAIAAYIKRTPRATWHLLATKQLPATKVGQTWVASRSKLRARLLGEEEAAA
jgi:hypothetical protein